MKTKVHFCIESRSIVYRGKKVLYHWEKYEDLKSKWYYQCFIISNFSLKKLTIFYQTNQNLWGRKSIDEKWCINNFRSNYDYKLMFL